MTWQSSTGDSDQRCGSGQFHLTLDPAPTLWCSCGKSVTVAPEDGYILGVTLARLRTEHRCGPTGSAWARSRSR